MQSNISIATTTSKPQTEVWLFVEENSTLSKCVQESSVAHKLGAKSARVLSPWKNPLPGGQTVSCCGEGWVSAWGHPQSGCLCSLCVRAGWQRLKWEAGPHSRSPSWQPSPRRERLLVQLPQLRSHLTQAHFPPHLLHAVLNCNPHMQASSLSTAPTQTLLKLLDLSRGTFKEKQAAASQISGKEELVSLQNSKHPKQTLCKYKACIASLTLLQRNSTPGVVSRWKLGRGVDFLTSCTLERDTKSVMKRLPGSHWVHSYTLVQLSTIHTGSLIWGWRTHRAKKVHDPDWVRSTLVITHNSISFSAYKTLDSVRKEKDADLRRERESSHPLKTAVRISSFRTIWVGSNNERRGGWVGARFHEWGGWPDALWQIPEARVVCNAVRREVEAWLDRRPKISRLLSRSIVSSFRRSLLKPRSWDGQWQCYRPCIASHTWVMSSSRDITLWWLISRTCNVRTHTVRIVNHL